MQDCLFNGGNKEKIDIQMLVQSELTSQCPPLVRRPSCCCPWCPLWSIKAMTCSPVWKTEKRLLATPSGVQWENSWRHLRNSHFPPFLTFLEGCNHHTHVYRVNKYDINTEVFIFVIFKLVLLKSAHSCHSWRHPSPALAFFLLFPALLSAWGQLPPPHTILDYLTSEQHYELSSINTLWSIHFFRNT